VQATAPDAGNLGTADHGWNCCGGSSLAEEKELK